MMKVKKKKEKKIISGISEKIPKTSKAENLDFPHSLEVTTRDSVTPKFQINTFRKVR